MDALANIWKQFRGICASKRPPKTLVSSKCPYISVPVSNIAEPNNDALLERLTLFLSDTPNIAADTDGWPPEDSAKPKFKWCVGISSVRTQVLDSQSGRWWAWRPWQFNLGIKRNQGRKKNSNILLGAAFINSSVCPSHPATQAGLPLLICKADTNSSPLRALRRMKWNSGHLQGTQPMRALWLLLWGGWDGTKQKRLGRRPGQNKRCSSFVVAVLLFVFSKLVPSC